MILRIYIKTIAILVLASCPLMFSCTDELPPASNDNLPINPSEFAVSIIGDTLFEKGFALTPLDPAIVIAG